MDSLQNNLIKLLNQDTLSFLTKQTGVSKDSLIPAVDSVVSFMLRLIERADTFNYYELASIFTRNGRETSTPDKIIAAIKTGHKHEALLDARKLLNVLLRDQQEDFQKMVAKQHNLSSNQSEQVVFIGAVFTNVLLGHCMISNKMNMRAITRHIKSEAAELSEKLTAEMKQLNRQLTSNNMMIDETKPLREEPKSNTLLYVGILIGFLIFITILFKACSSLAHQ